MGTPSWLHANDCQWWSQLINTNLFKESLRMIWIGCPPQAAKTFMLTLESMRFPANILNPGSLYSRDQQPTDHRPDPAHHQCHPVHEELGLGIFSSHWICYRPGNEQQSLLPKLIKSLCHIFISGSLANSGVWQWCDSHHWASGTFDEKVAEHSWVQNALVLLASFAHSTSSGCTQFLTWMLKPILICQLWQPD